MGFVDVIEGTRNVRPLKKPLYKFILNNDDGRRVRILMWDDHALKYAPRIVDRSLFYFILFYFILGYTHQASKNCTMQHDILQTE